jgi:hypothetical protein
VHRKCRIASIVKKIYFAPVKHSGKAAAAAFKLIGLSAAGVLLLLAVAWLAAHLGAFIVAMAGVLGALWVLFVLFTFYFFRDPDPKRLTWLTSRNFSAANAGASPFSSRCSTCTCRMRP